MKAEELMLKAQIISPEKTVSKASGIMKEKGLRELIISERGRLLGMINTLWMTEVDSKPDTKVGSIMFSPPTVKPTDDLDEVIRKMVDNAVETIPILDGDSLIGTVTTEQIIKKADFEGKVRDVMVDAVSIRATETINKARRIMRLHHINRLPVLDGNNLVGIISSSDIVKKMSLKRGYPKRSDMIGDVIKFLDAPVSAIMTAPVFTINADKTLNEAARKMVSNDVRALPVVSNNRLLGILCRKDMIKTLYPYVSGVLVNFSGLKNISDWDVMQLKRATRDWIKKLNYYVPLTDVLIDVKKLHASNLYRMNIHLNQSKKMYLKPSRKVGSKIPEAKLMSTKSEGYGLVPVTNEAFSKLEKVLSKTKP
jgi:CBS domain-containing protein